MTTHPAPQPKERATTWSATPANQEQTAPPQRCTNRGRYFNLGGAWGAEVRPDFSHSPHRKRPKDPPNPRATLADSTVPAGKLQPGAVMRAAPWDELLVLSFTFPRLPAGLRGGFLVETFAYRTLRRDVHHTAPFGRSDATRSSAPFGRRLVVHFVAPFGQLGAQPGNSLCTLRARRETVQSQDAPFGHQGLVAYRPAPAPK